MKKCSPLSMIVAILAWLSIIVVFLPTRSFAEPTGKWTFSKRLIDEWIIESTKECGYKK